MAWTDRVKKASYTSPSGVNTEFNFEDVSVSFTHKGTAFNFPDVEGSYGQQTGRTGRRYPMKCYIWGEDYDLAAKEFITSLEEKGLGRLNHPLYGNFDVIILGEVTRNDALKTAANQAVIELTFYDTTTAIYPYAQKDATGQTEIAITSYNNAMGEDFGGAVKFDNVTDKTTFMGQYTSLLNGVKSSMSPLVTANATIKKQFDTIYKSIFNGLDVGVGNPLMLAFQTIQLIQAPSRAYSLIKNVLNGYKNLFKTLTNGSKSTSKNQLKAKDLYVSSVVSAMVLSTSNATYKTKNDAVFASVALLDTLDDLNTFRDDEYANLGEIDTGEAYQALQNAIAVTAGTLIEASFDLRQEKFITLDRDRTIIDLCFELYGKVDDELDFFIASNSLSGSEILELPKGKKIAYYI